MNNKTLYRWDAEAEALRQMSPEVQAIVIQNSKIWDEWELVKRSVYEIIAHTWFRANFSETADFVSSISHKVAPNLREEIGIVNMTIMCWSLTREENLPKIIKMLSNQ